MSLIQSVSLINVIFIILFFWMSDFYETSVQSFVRDSSATIITDGNNVLDQICNHIIVCYPFLKVLAH